ncbi:MAG: helix-turn-helix domain-containing protein [Erysipelotrichales bacterium]|nr:helix-turn-helix domain-containing protein [Erysipelotrichales bacterium]
MRNLKETRIKKGLSQKDLAELTNIPQTTLSGYENSSREPRVDDMAKIAIAMNMTVDELIDFRRIHD